MPDGRTHSQRFFTVLIRFRYQFGSWARSFPVIPWENWIVRDLTYCEYDTDCLFCVSHQKTVLYYALSCETHTVVTWTWNWDDVKIRILYKSNMKDQVSNIKHQRTKSVSFSNSWISIRMSLTSLHMLSSTLEFHVIMFYVQMNLSLLLTLLFASL